MLPRENTISQAEHLEADAASPGRGMQEDSYWEIRKIIETGELWSINLEVPCMANEL